MDGKAIQRFGCLEGVRIMALSLTLASLLGGCASFSPDGGMAVVQDHAGGVLGKDVVKIGGEAEAAAARARVEALLAQPLPADAAVQIALLNNRGLQAAYNDLGVSEAEMIEASLPPAPTISLARLAGAELEIERQIVQNVLALLTLPRRREIAEDRFRQAQVEAIEATLKTAVEARRAYYRAVAASETVSYLQKSRVAAEASSELAKKLGETGALPKLQQAREHVFYGEVSGELAIARLRERGEREKLNRALGLWGTDLRYTLPKALPALPARPASEPDIETRAVTQRADLAIARLDLEILGKELGLTEATRFIDVLEVSGLSRYERSRATETDFTLDQGPPPSLDRHERTVTDKIPRRGLEVTFQIPIYDFGETRTRKAGETYLRAVNLLIEKAVDVRSEAREAYTAYRGAYDIARHFETEIVPLNKIVTEQAVLNTNGMLTDLFTLLNDARTGLAANVRAIEAKRDFWLAKSDLDAAIHGGGQGAPIAETMRMPASTSTGGGSD